MTARLLSPLLLAGWLVSAMLQPVAAQNVLALVNQTPITSFDVQQRIRIAAMIERRKLDQRTSLQELVDDQVKLIQARRSGYRVTDEGVDAEFLRVAKNNRQTPDEFSAVLRRAGLEPNALRDKMRADIAWNVILRDQARKGSQVTNEEIDREMSTKKKKQKEIIDYQIQSVIFVVPQGGSAGERQRAAGAARNRFTSCETGFDELRTLRDVAVRPPILRSTEGMSDQLAAVLAKTPVGRLTPPFPSEQGIEMVAVCERKPREAVPSGERLEIASALAEKRVGENTKSYLASLRKTVDIRFMR